MRYKNVIRFDYVGDGGEVVHSKEVYCTCTPLSTWGAEDILRRSLRCDNLLVRNICQVDTGRQLSYPSQRSRAEVTADLFTVALSRRRCRA